MNFSVLMSVYRNDSPKFVQRAIDSITSEQTLKPNEVVLVIDGPVPDELKNLIKQYGNQDKEIFKIIWIQKKRWSGECS